MPISLNERLQAQDYIRGGSLSVTNRKFNNRTVTHWHNYFEIEIIISGKGKEIIDGKEYELKPNTIFLLTPINFHSVIIERGYECISINASFTSEMLSDRMMIYFTSKAIKNYYEFEPTIFDQIITSFKMLAYEQNINSEYRYTLLDYCLSLILRNSQISVLSDFDDEQISGIRRALLYLELNFREKITLSQLANLAGYNPSYFSNTFHRLTGETYIETLNKLRVKHAKIMLAEGYSVSETCFASGFGSLSNFLTIFKNKCGMTPNDYKKNIISNILHQ